MEPTPERQSHARPHETPPVGGDLWARGGLPVERRTGGPAYRPEADRNGLGRFAGGHLSRLFAILLVALLVLYPAACGDAERENAERGDAAAAGTKAGQGTGDRRGAASAKPESDDRDRTARAGGSRSENARSGAGETNARSGEAKADAGSVAIAGSTTRGPAGDARGQTKVALEITGERGAGFSGVCAVGARSGPWTDGCRSATSSSPGARSSSAA